MKQVDEQVTELLTATRPELSARWQERVLEKARRPAVRHRRHWVAIAVGAAVVLAGLGLIPFRAEDAKGLLGRAMAAMEEASSVHFAGYGTAPDESSPTGMKMMPERFEFWVSDRAITMRTVAPDGTLVATSGLNLDTNEQWSYGADGGIRYTADLTPVAGPAAVFVSSVSHALLSGSIGQALSSNLSDVRESVSTEVRDGRRVLVVTYAGTLKASRRRVTERFVLTIEEATERLIEMRQYAQAEGNPEELIGHSEVIEYDVPVPADLAPAGVAAVTATLEAEETEKVVRLIMKVGDKVIERAEAARLQ